MSVEKRISARGEIAEWPKENNFSVSGTEDRFDYYRTPVPSLSLTVLGMMSYYTWNTLQVIQKTN